MATKRPQNGQRGLASGPPLSFWVLLSTFAMRKGRDGGNKNGGKKKTSLGAPGALTHRLLNPKRPTGAPKMADGVWKEVQSQVIGRSAQLLLNKFFDRSTPSMRNIEPPAKSKMAIRGTQNGQRGLESGPILGYWAL